MSDYGFYNEIIYVIENNNRSNPPTVVKGFSSVSAVKENGLVFKDFMNSKVYVFEKLWNEKLYTRKEAFDILGGCSLVTAINNDYVKDKDVKNLKQDEIKKMLESSVPVWKSDTSRYFILAGAVKTL